MYYIGIDGGGTKTLFGLFKDKHCIDTVTLTTCHYAQVGYNGCAQVLKEGIHYFINKYNIDSKDVIIGAGIAGFGQDENIRSTLKEVINSAIERYKIYITNDVHVTLFGALEGQDGCVVIAGTGTIAMQLHQYQISRVGGWGYLLGDEGSGYWIGRQMLSMFTKQADNRIEKTALYQGIKEYYRIKDSYSIINIVNSMENRRTEIAKLALLCDTLAKEKDPICIQILEKAAKEASLLVKGLQKQQTTSSLVSYYGSVFKSTIFLDAFTKHLPEYYIIKPINNAIYGAVLFAIDMENNKTK